MILRSLFCLCIVYLELSARTHPFCRQAISLQTSTKRSFAYSGPQCEQHHKTIEKLEGKYSLESTDPRESEIRAPPEPLQYLMPIPPTRFFITNSTY